MDKKVKLKLVGLDGNSFMLLGAFSKAAKEQGFDKKWIDNILDLATSGDRNHLLRTLIENTTEGDRS